MHPKSGTLQTITSEPARPPAVAEAVAWRLTIASHDQAELVGRSVPLLVPGELVVGRHDEWLGASTFRDPRVSRRHARFLLAADGVLLVEDLGSHNGTLVDGARVERHVLVDGDVVSVGGVLLLAHRAPREPRSVDLEMARWAHTREPVAIVGEPGTGRSRLAAQLHALGGRTGRLLVIAAGALGDELVLPTLHGNEAGAYPGALEARAGLLEEAAGGTLVIDGVELARPALLTALAAFLEHGEVARVGGARTRTLDVRVVVIGTSVPAALAPHFGLAVVVVPPLRARREEIPALARAAAGCPIDGALMRALLAHPWPGNVRELCALVGGAARARDGDGALRLTPALASALGAERALGAMSAAEGRAAVARSGAFFEGPAGRRVELGSRKALRAILARLVEACLGGGGAGLGVEELVSAGWPGERIAPSAAATRVHTAIATLRRDGLKDLLHRDARGYHLGPAGAFDVIEA